MATYWTNFVKTGNPNRPSPPGGPLPNWPSYKGESAGDPSSDAYWIMHLTGKRLGAAPDTVRVRYQFLDAHSAASPKKE